MRTNTKRFGEGEAENHKTSDFLKSGESDERRCDSVESLRIRMCNSEHIIDPKPSIFTMKDNKLNSDLANVVQLKPQSLRVKLRVGVPQDFRVEFRRAEGYPIDLYYLMDLSYSMKDDLDKIKNLGQDILDNLKKVTNTVRIGFGSFVDKEKLPYVSQVQSRRLNPCPTRTDTCQPAFTFHNVLPLTSEAREFKKEVSKQKISGNLDSPEAGLDAIMQAAVCQEKIGWKDVTRILVYTSDDTFHMAGDGRLAGIFTPHDGKCHLNPGGFYNGALFDYPSVGHLSQVLQANNIQLIFAVTKNSFSAYQSVVGVLENDSSNVVQLISEAYGNLSSTLLLEHNMSLPGLHVSYKSHCNQQTDITWQKRGECTGIRDEKVSFTVRLNATECLTDSKTFQIQLKGIKEVLMVTVETLCNCDCGKIEENSSHCAGKGTLDCGICRCNKGFLGQHCKCETTSDSVMHLSCHRNNSSQECSGHGHGVCECGQCVCSGHFHGTHCECNDAGCERYNNKICNETVDKTKVIISSSVSGIIFIGILVIVIYKILLELYDRREYQNFIKAQENTKWDEVCL
ncbi:Integrin beta-7 [Bagarius yarrelli]|uniref:Integrin beta n=1 Tax=Bagarius yarrelli TaxID=175774 RepID=A0A556VU14_BAGYA|nr:Integrin beta-7 [Bagarius yarrelli]